MILQHCLDNENFLFLCIQHRFDSFKDILGEWHKEEDLGFSFLFQNRPISQPFSLFLFLCIQHCIDSFKEIFFYFLILIIYSSLIILFLSLFHFLMSLFLLILRIRAVDGSSVHMHFLYFYLSFAFYTSPATSHLSSHFTPLLFILLIHSSPSLLLHQESSLLLATNAFGVWECCSNSEECTFGAECVENTVTTRGVDLPLEVFRTAGGCGWGVRCNQHIVPGQVVASYEGELITNAEAECRRTCDSYLFDLDHFILVAADPTTDAQQRAALPPLPPTYDSSNSTMDSLEAPDARHLVIDAQHRGNIGKFFNHSCSPNLIVQPMLTQGCSGLRYRDVFVAKDAIYPGVEMCYNYGSRYFFRNGDEEVPCACGAANCRGTLAS